MKVDLLYYTKDPINAIEKAASTCYDSVPTDGNIMKHCYKSGHHSVLEFADFTFRIEGVSRALSHQLVRHRIASYAQRSQRYCKEDGFTYTIPDSLSITYAGNLVLSTDKMGLAGEIESMKTTAEQVIASVDHQKEILQKASSLLAELNPAYKERQETEQRFNKIEGSISRIEEMMANLVKELKG